MISQLKGILVEKVPPFLVVDVMGVGYEVEAPMSTFYQLPEAGAEVRLLTHLIIREDAHILYGFYSKQERILFRQLIKVNSIGPRSAITILSAMDYQEFISSIAGKNLGALTRIPGIGKKTAERLLLEMQDRLGKEIEGLGAVESSHSVSSVNNDQVEEARQAMLALGYKLQEANRVLKQFAPNTELSTQDIIRLALQKM